MKMIDIIYNIEIADHIWNKFWIGVVTFVGIFMDFRIEENFYATILLQIIIGLSKTIVTKARILKQELQAPKCAC